MKENGLDWGKLYQLLIDFGVNELIKYQETIEIFLSQEKKTMNSKFYKIEYLKEENEEYYHDMVDSLSEEYHNYDKFYPNSFRSSIIIQSYSFLEYHLKRICDHVCQSQSLKFSLEDLKGNSNIEKSKIYLTNTSVVNIGNFNPEWCFINKVRILRNSIVHSTGEFKIKETKLVNFIKEHGSLSVKDNKEDFDKGVDRTYEVIITDEKLNLEFINQIKTFFGKLTNEAFKKKDKNSLEQSA